MSRRKRQADGWISGVAKSFRAPRFFGWADAHRSLTVAARICTENFGSSIRRLAGVPARMLVRLHRDDQGAVSVLVLMTIWCLVTMLGMLWNTTEQAVNRQRVQTAADSAAHMAATWQGRAVNAIAAQNMVIGEDASTEVIWRAIPPTDQMLQAHYQQELARAARMQANPQWAKMRAQFQPTLDQIRVEHDATVTALASLQANVAGAGYKDAGEAMVYTNNLRQAKSALDWVNDTFMNGVVPPVAAAPAQGRPGAPGPKAEGLAALINKYPPAASEAQILNMIVGYIGSNEMPVVRAFEDWTRAVTNQPVDSQMAAHEAEVYQNEIAMVAAVPDAVEASRRQLVDFYRTDMTLATLNQGKNDYMSAASPSSPVVAPLVPASLPASVTIMDTIRAAYPNEAAAARLSPMVTIDPINTTEENRIWHPPLTGSVDAGTLIQFPNLTPTFTVNCNLPAIRLTVPELNPGWADVRAAPLEKYVHERVNRDREKIGQMFFNTLDSSRANTLATSIQTMMGVPAFDENQLQLPALIPDDAPQPVIPPAQPGPPRYGTVAVLPQLYPPAGATPEVIALYAQYNQHGRSYTDDVQNLAEDFRAYLDYFNGFTTEFSWQMWDSNVQAECLYVLDQLGQHKQFMVLSTHQLRMIPEWARPALYNSITQYVESQIIAMNIDGIQGRLTNDLVQQDPRNLGSGFLDPRGRNRTLRGQYQGEAQAIAMQILQMEAHRAALAIATECLNRPWPFEITPPDMEVPPMRGMGVRDRQESYTVLAAARQQDGAGPRLLLPTILNSTTDGMVAYAQGETFNWMEFNAAYGGSETLVTPVVIGDFVYTNWNVRNFLPVPRGWRVGTVGGWNWRSRLSLSDGLYGAAETNPEFAAYLNAAGFTTFDQATLNEINLH